MCFSATLATASDSGESAVSTEEDNLQNIQPNIRGLSQSATLAINEKCKILRAQGRKVYNFGLGQSPFPVPEPVVEELRRNAHRREYLPVKGLPELREAVCEFHRRMDQVNLLPKNVIVGPGSKELLFLCQLVFAGESIFPTPRWVSYIPQVHILRKKARIIHTSYRKKWRVTAEQLKGFCEHNNANHKAKMLLLNYPSNPDGGTYSPEELKDIAEVARKYHLIVLSDEIYARLHYKGGHVSIARYYPEGTIISSGLSKWAGAGGWRLGTFAFPPELSWLMDAISVAASETYTSVSAPIQYAGVRAFHGDGFMEHYLKKVRRILRGLAETSVRMLRGAGVKLHAPTGAFYLFLNFGGFHSRLAGMGVSDGAGLCELILKDTGVAILPGSAFGRSRAELTARLAFVNFDGALALKASESITDGEPLKASFFEENCPETMEGVRRLAEWVATVCG